MVVYHRQHVEAQLGVRHFVRAALFGLSLADEYFSRRAWAAYDGVTPVSDRDKSSKQLSCCEDQRKIGAHFPFKIIDRKTAASYTCSWTSQQTKNNDSTLTLPSTSAITASFEHKNYGFHPRAAKDDITAKDSLPHPWSRSPLLTEILSWDRETRTSYLSELMPRLVQLSDTPTVGDVAKAETATVKAVRAQLWRSQGHKKWHVDLEGRKIHASTTRAEILRRLRLDSDPEKVSAALHCAKVKQLGKLHLMLGLGGDALHGHTRFQYVVLQQEKKEKEDARNAEPKRNRALNVEAELSEDSEGIGEETPWQLPFFIDDATYELRFRCVPASTKMKKIINARSYDVTFVTSSSLLYPISSLTRTSTRTNR
ncbi:unnamed protein product [Amoebophrya sp. A25]|nr:unnamed protein product [Amoebophrya sp. A25]|eukprot:GSA25T00013513001.1